MLPEVVHGIAQTRNTDDQLVLRLIVALEVWLSAPAAWDVEVSSKDTGGERSYITQLLTGDDKT
jgi:hypothetical protein